MQMKNLKLDTNKFNGLNYLPSNSYLLFSLNDSYIYIQYFIYPLPRHFPNLNKLNPVLLCPHFAILLHLIPLHYI